MIIINAILNCEIWQQFYDCRIIEESSTRTTTTPAIACSHDADLQPYSLPLSTSNGTSSWKQRFRRASATGCGPAASVSSRYDTFAGRPSAIQPGTDACTPAQLENVTERSPRQGLKSNSYESSLPQCSRNSVLSIESNETCNLTEASPSIILHRLLFFSFFVTCPQLN